MLNIQQVLLRLNGFVNVRISQLQTILPGSVVSDLPLFKGIPIHVFIAGRSIRDAASPVEAARQFKRSIAELWG